MLSVDNTDCDWSYYCSIIATGSQNCKLGMLRLLLSTWETVMKYVWYPACRPNFDWWRFLSSTLNWAVNPANKRPDVFYKCQKNRSDYYKKYLVLRRVALSPLPVLFLHYDTYSRYFTICFILAVYYFVWVPGYNLQTHVIPAFRNRPPNQVRSRWLALMTLFCLSAYAP
jgi:hypothetical protein